ncbi:DNA ligase [uncultured Ferrimonas sp.]|uniref:DNA ligase n=1 Tax=uncultured Ferrimonas sp. TaxID=432640 RepID=UPI002612DEAD|nr:DNA ligase [uncultured Ferrimonas sp.]
MTLPYPALWLSGAAALLPTALYAKGPDLMLAKSYHQDVEVSSYLISEKYDGMRAYWTGSKLVSRSGHKIAAPAWFIAALPAMPLDGELWLGRGQFQALMSIVRDAEPDEEQWRQVRYMVFDLPMSLNPFHVRQREITQLLTDLNQPHLQAVPQHKVEDAKQLQALFRQHQLQGAEGLILKRYDSPYLSGRSPLMLKMKAYQDAEAVVVAHLPGKGKYQGLLGALLVKDASGREFKLGSGLSDQLRHHPPAIGSVVTYRYNGFTDSGLPRFARFDRSFSVL